MSEAERAALHAVRVRGAASVADVARISGLEDPGAALAALLDAGLVSETGGYHALTEAGRERDAELSREALGARAGELAAVYDQRFLPVNVRFKALATAWQERGEQIELIEEAAELHDELEAVLADSVGPAPHLRRYQERLGAAMDRFLGGEGAALAGAQEDSYHSTWFELHEDLIATLGRSREKEEA